MRIDRPGDRRDQPDEDDQLPESPRRPEHREAPAAGPDGGIPADRAEYAREYRETVDDVYRDYAIDKGCHPQG